MAVILRLQEEGRHGEAIPVARAWLAAHPDDGGVRWTLARLLFWSGDVDGAVVAFREARRALPRDPWLALEEAEALVARGAWKDAGILLSELAAGRPPGAEAHALARLGSLAYWTGDYARAVDVLEEALARDPGLEDARRTLSEIRLLAAPRVAARVEWVDDDQPLQRLHAGAEASVHLTPAWTLRLAGAAVRLGNGAAPATSGEGGGALHGTLPGARVEVWVEAGGAWGGEGKGPDGIWTGAAGLGLRLAPETTLRATARRARYLGTLASVDTLLAVHRLEIALDRRGHPGFAGEAVLRLDGYPDANRVRTAFVWALAPVLPGLRLGAAASWADADEVRWIRRPGAAVEADGTVPGRYAPYHTPDDQRAVSVLAEWTASAPWGRFSLTGDAPVTASERAPVLVDAGPGGGEPVLAAYRRDTRPWGVRASARIHPAGATSLDVDAERRSTPFYTVTRLGIKVSHRVGDPWPR